MENLQPDHNRQNKIAVINDFSGFGRCSIAVALPILSVMGLQCCPLPTSVFSNHTGFPSYFFRDFTEYMPAYTAEWKKLDLRFHGIATGFLGSAEQIRHVKSFLADFKREDTLVLVDPVMGDYGRLYSTYTLELAGRMHELVPYADVLTPNLTEACILTGRPYREDYSAEDLADIARTLSEQGPQKVVISGIGMGESVGNFVYETGQEPVMIATHRIGGNRSGTGDVFSALLIGFMAKGYPFRAAVEHSAAFISHAITCTIELGIPSTDGLAIEECLWELGDELHSN